MIAQLRATFRWLIAGLMGLLAIAALLFRGQAQRAAADAKDQKGRADDAQSRLDLQHRIDSNLAAVERRHREEQRASDKRVAEGKRDHLDNHWGP